MTYRIVSESVSNAYKYKDIAYTCIHAKIDTCTTRYEDHRGLNVSLMMEELSSYCGEVEVSIPEVKDWFNAIKEEDVTFLLPNASILSKSYQNAILAKNKYMAMYPDKKVFVINTNTTGPAIKLIIEKLSELIHANLSVEKIMEEINEYVQKVHVSIVFDNPSSLIKEKLFSWKERISDSLGMFTLSTLKTQRPYINKKQAFLKIVNTLKADGFDKTKLIISHTDAKADATLLSIMLKEVFGSISIDIINNSGVNAYIYGKGAIIIGYEI